MLKKRGIKEWVFLFFLLVCLLYLPNKALAHSVEKNGPVLIMLHASPGDSPIIGQSAKLTFYITDSQKRFKATECDCRLEMSFNNEIILSTTSFSIIKNNPVFSFIFPQKGLYEVRLIAAPKIEGAFQSFVFNDDDFSVSRTPEGVRATKIFFYRLYALVTLVLLFIFLFIKRKLNRNKLTKNTPV